MVQYFHRALRGTSKTDMKVGDLIRVFFIIIFYGKSLSWTERVQGFVVQSRDRASGHDHFQERETSRGGNAVSARGDGHQ